MMDLETILRTRMAIQLGHGEGRPSLVDALDRAIWIYGPYGLNARLEAPMRSPIKRLKTETRAKLPIGRAYRVISTRMVKLLLPGFRQPVSDEELLECIPPGGIARQQLAKQLDMSVRKLNYRLRKEQNNWTIIKHDDTIYTSDDFVKEIEQPNAIKDRILAVLGRYPYVTVDQLELFTGCTREEIAGPIAELGMQEKIVRGLTRAEAPDEVFCLPDQPLVDDVDLPTVVMERRDALVEMTKLERYFDHENADYWLFVDGIPQAEFDLDRKSRSSQYTIKNLNRFVTTTMELTDILAEIVSWGKHYSISVLADQIDDELTNTFKKLTTLLLDRGYQFDDTSLVLDRHKVKTKQTTQSSSTEEPVGRPEVLDWHLLGPWCKNRQFLEFDGTPQELLYHLGPVADIRSLAYRLQANPDQLDLEDIVYIPGINHRMEFMPKHQVEDIIRGWPKQTRYTFLDKQIQAAVQQPRTTSEIIAEVNESPITIKQRLRYLEQSRSIRKQLPGSLDMNECTWILFDTGLDDYSKPAGGKRAMASVATFMFKVLENNPPLTKPQLSRYLGLTVKEIEPMIRRYLRTGEIIEGYFLADLSTIQYTLPEVIDTLPAATEDRDDTSAVNRVDILPLSDPFATLHLPPLVMDDPSIQPTARLAEQAEQWMVMWDGQPVGYFIKQPTKQQLLDYELDLKITAPMVTTPIIAGTLQKVVTLFRTWFGDEGKIKSINNEQPSNSKWEDIHFLIESIGIQMD